MENLVVGAGKGIRIWQTAGVEVGSNLRLSTDLCSNRVFLDSQLVCRALLGDRIYCSRSFSCGSSNGVKTVRGIRLKTLVGLLKKDLNDRGDATSRFAAWRDGASAWTTGADGAGSASFPERSGNALQLRKFLKGYEGWQGEKAPRTSSKIIGRKKKRKHGEKLLQMLKALDENPNIDEALEPWKGLLTENEQGMLLNDQWRCDRALELFRWFNEEEGYRPNTCHYTIMLKKCGRAQKWDLVRNLLSEMQVKNVKMNSYTYNTLIDVNEKAGRKAEATFWFECSKREGFLDEVAIGSQITVFKDFGDFEEGSKLYESLPSILSQKHLSTGNEIYSCTTLLLLIIGLYGLVGSIFLVGL